MPVCDLLCKLSGTCIYSLLYVKWFYCKFYYRLTTEGTQCWLPALIYHPRCYLIVICSASWNISFSTRSKEKPRIKRFLDSWQQLSICRNRYCSELPFNFHFEWASIKASKWHAAGTYAGFNQWATTALRSVQGTYTWLCTALVEAEKEANLA